MNLGTRSKKSKQHLLLFVFLVLGFLLLLVVSQMVKSDVNAEEVEPTEIQEYNYQESILENKLVPLLERQGELQEQLSGINYQIVKIKNKLNTLYSQQREILDFIKEQKTTPEKVEHIPQVSVKQKEAIKEQPKAHESAPKKVERVDRNSILTNKTEVIGCINKYTYETREPKNGKCLGIRKKGAQNIMLPPKSHIKYWAAIRDDRQIINRLPVVNFESAFNPYAENSIARGYVQTLKKWNISTDIWAQLEWMANRMEHQKTKGNCKRQQGKGELRMMQCLRARHYGAQTISHWYVKKNTATRAYYFKYLGM